MGAQLIFNRKALKRHSHDGKKREDSGGERRRNPKYQISKTKSDSFQKKEEKKRSLLIGRLYHPGHRGEGEVDARIRISLLQVHRTELGRA